MKKWPLLLVLIVSVYFAIPQYIWAELNGFPNLTDTAIASRGTNAAGLVSWWRLDGGKANTSLDYGTNQATGTYVNGVTNNANGQILGCTKHPGLTSGINIGKCGLMSAFATNTSPWTFSAWINTTNTVGQDIYSEGNSTNAAGNQFIRFMTSRSTPGDFCVSFRYDNGTGLQIFSTTGATGTNSNNGAWHLFTVTHPSMTNYILYVDGGFKQTNSVTSASLPLTLDVAAIGYLRRNTASSQWVGFIDDVRLYNRTLEVQEITNLYNKIAP